ncbi:MAG TPA: formate dehydrogenase accessory sulfurtransferase FdhD [Dokdonella sp.]
MRRPVRRWRGGQVAQLSDCIAEEVPIALLYNERPHVVMMATPRDLDDFALGFSLSEAIIDRADELESVATQTLLEGIEVRLRVPEARADALETRRRNLTGRTSCGLCGAQALEDAVRQPAAVRGGPHIDSAILQHALAQMHQRQPLNVATGATHAAAWADASGDIVLLREDVGRHNALDKLIGALMRGGEDVQRGFLVVTSRASYEMVQKAATLGITLMAAISAPTALAIHLADQTGVTLIGFARSESHVIYTQSQRILDLRPEPSA